MDGAHIALLLEALFLTHLRPLLEEGRIYRVQVPLYGIQKGKEMQYFYTEEELNIYSAKFGYPNPLFRFKGLGSMNSDSTEYTIMNPDTRKLQHITVEDCEKAVETFNVLMGKDLAARRELASNIDYGMEGEIEEWLI